MRTFLHRLLGLARARGFDAAGGGRRWHGARTVDGLNAAILAGATTAARRAGWYARNNPWVAAAVDSLVGNVVGAGIKPQSTHPDRAVRERLQALWLRWTDHAAPDGLADFYGLQAMAVRAMVESGESFARLRVANDAATIPLHLELLDREQVPMELHREIGGGARIRAGIEFDAAGRRVAYRVLSSRPGDPLGSFRMDPPRVPAADCLHLFKPLAAGQLRGITWLAPVLLRLHELDQFEDAALVKAKVAALFTGFITDPDGTAGDPALRARQMGEALYARINPRHELSEPARRYAYATPVDMAKELLTLRGESTMALSPASLVTRALHTTSDFPIILGDTVGRVLRDAYQAAPSGIRRLGRQTTARDFRAMNKIMLGEAPLLEKLNEHGEIKAGTMAEAREAYKVETWARKIGITRQVLVNDDLGAFADLARRMGQAAAETEARILVTLLEAGSGNGPTMSDGKTLFHADHGNKAGTGAAISDATLSAARLALRTQKGIEDRTIRVTPRNLLVPPALETTAEKWLASIAPATAADVNPFSGSLSLVVEPRLSSAARWYVTADPGEIDGLEFAYLSGAEGPQVESRSGWDVDGVEIRVILDFGAGFIDHRGWFMNPGA
ncbi:phage portal protein, lambda family [Ruegeria lacuscaerulensis ITI-1157]|nr:phage portal protein, lambda family [Ruegeria lacuscaerulensis ITI-1157]